MHLDHESGMVGKAALIYVMGVGIVFATFVLSSFITPAGEGAWREEQVRDERDQLFILKSYRVIFYGMCVLAIFAAVVLHFIAESPDIFPEFSGSIPTEIVALSIPPVLFAGRVIQSCALLWYYQRG